MWQELTKTVLSEKVGIKPMKVMVWNRICPHEGLRPIATWISVLPMFPVPRLVAWQIMVAANLRKAGSPDLSVHGSESWAIILEITITP